MKRTTKSRNTIGYLRVSTDGQDLEKNKADILAFANERKLGHVTWIEEKVSGRVDWRKRQIGQLITQDLRAGDVIITPELSRLGRSMFDIIEMLKLAMEKGIRICALKGSWELNGSMQSKVVAMVLSMVSEIERDLISARIKEALKARKAAGVKLGRRPGPSKSKLDPHREEIVALLKNGSTLSYVARRYNTTPANLHGYLRKRGIDARPVYPGKKGKA